MKGTVKELHRQLDDAYGVTQRCEKLVSMMAHHEKGSVVLIYGEEGESVAVAAFAGEDLNEVLAALKELAPQASVSKKSSLVWVPESLGVQMWTTRSGWRLVITGGALCQLYYDRESTVVPVAETNDAFTWAEKKIEEYHGSESEGSR